MNSTNLALTASKNLDALIVNPLPKENVVRLLRLPLELGDSALLPLEQIREIIRVDVAEILPVPEMPSCVLGICNWRGEMLWVVDLNDLVGYPSPFRTQQLLLSSLMILVIQVNNQSIGLGVQQVKDIELHDMRQLMPATPGLFSSSLLPFVAGTLPGCGDAVLDVKAITQCPLWKKHQRGGA
jgi:positive phototaxis protein PixI